MIIDGAADGRFSGSYNETCFAFRHTLHLLPHFDVANLIDVGERLPAVYYEVGAGEVGDGWRGERSDRPSLRETMEGLERTNALIIMKDVGGDPALGPIVTELVAEIYDAVGRQLSADVEASRATLIIGSPYRVTPYHFDGETNYLFQLRGTKDLSVFDQRDRSVVTDQELEGFYAGNLSAAMYRPEQQGRATEFHFAAGSGVHIPLHAPHWVRNLVDVSVALSVNFTLRSTHRSAQLYAFNHLMRKSGIEPSPPGLVGWKDRIKSAAARGFSLARSCRKTRAIIRTQ